MIDGRPLWPPLPRPGDGSMRPPARADGHRHRGCRHPRLSQNSSHSGSFGRSVSYRQVPEKCKPGGNPLRCGDVVMGWRLSKIPPPSTVDYDAPMRQSCLRSEARSAELTHRARQGGVSPAGAGDQPAPLPPDGRRPDGRERVGEGVDVHRAAAGQVKARTELRG
jgi:hypothetical protein